MDDYDDGLTRVNPGFGRPKFSKIELRDILISMLVLTLAFTILYRSGSILYFFEVKTGSETLAYVGLFAMCFVLVIFSFLLHEFGHKFTAQRAGLWSEYRMFPVGLVITLVSSFLGFLFASPGAVYIRGNMDDRTNGKVSIAGPIVNIILAAVGIAGCLAFNYSAMVVPMLLLANLNAFLAVFNLLPIPPLDGSKIFKWNIGIWIATIAIAAVELIYVLKFMPTLYWA